MFGPKHYGLAKARIRCSTLCRTGGRILSRYDRCQLCKSRWDRILLEFAIRCVKIFYTLRRIHDAAKSSSSFGMYKGLTSNASQYGQCLRLKGWTSICSVILRGIKFCIMSVSASGSVPCRSSYGDSESTSPCYKHICIGSVWDVSYFAIDVWTLPKHNGYCWWKFQFFVVNRRVSTTEPTKCCSRRQSRRERLPCNLYELKFGF